MTKITLPPPLATLVYPFGLSEADYQTPSHTAITHLPAITVLTPSYNQAEFLETTIRSVLLQGYPKLQYIIVDGGSTDESRRILEYYSPFISRWTSEPDAGQADAIRKGLGWAEGEWFNWINSDDVLAPGALWSIAHAAQDTDVVAGAAIDFLDNKRIRFTTNEYLTLHDLIEEERWHQPAVWLRRTVVQEIGLSGSLHYRFDYHLILRYLSRYGRIRRIENILAYFRLHGASKTMSQRRRFIAEKRMVLEEILDDPGFERFRPRIDMLIRQLQWRELLETVSADRSRSRWSRILQVLGNIKDDRSARWTGTTRRALIRLALRGGSRRRKPGRPLE